VLQLKILLCSTIDLWQKLVRRSQRSFSSVIHTFNDLHNMKLVASYAVLYCQFFQHLSHSRMKWNGCKWQKNIFRHKEIIYKQIKSGVKK